RIEIITNPSVKFDASTTGGILNVILKKNSKPGYNGMVMGGVGTGDRYNGMGNLNVKEGKINVSMMYNFNTQTNNNDGFTNRNSITLPPPNPLTGQVNKYYYQTDTNHMKNTFQFARLSVDYYINNRNTLTLAGNYVHGQFASSDNQHYRYNDVNDVLIFGGQRVNTSTTAFDNYTGQLQYKRTFPKQGKEFTTDVTVNGGSSNTTYTYTTYQNPFPALNQTSKGGTPSWMYTYQSDYVNPINDHSKLEAGVRSNMSRSFSTQQTFNDSVGKDIAVSDLTNNYNITNLTNAAYINYSSKLFEINYQAGLRFEQSYYKGNITNKDITFQYTYPSNTLNNLQYCLFPAIYLSKKLPKNQELQVNFSRKINRPNFFQLMPFVMFSDNANIRIGNPQLKPEFLNLSEINYNITSSSGKINYLVSAYFRYTENPITNVAYPEASNPNVLVNTFQNGKNSLVEGLDNTLKVTPFKNFDVTLNANVFYTTINYLSGTQLIVNNGVSWTGKAGLSYKFPADFSMQVNGNYQAPQILPQGTTREVKYMDVTVSKSIKQKLTFTLLLSDVFNSKRMGTNYVTPDYLQQLSRRRETRYLRLSVTYMFGKLDSSIFKKRMPKGNQNSTGNADGLDF
ncbi:MAG: outer membrane beta-barrel family protein, partial [Bacteroidia bacterium]